MQDESVIPLSQIHLIIVIPVVVLAALFAFAWQPRTAEPPSRRPGPASEGPVYAPVRPDRTRPAAAPAPSKEKLEEIKEQQGMCLECHDASYEPSKTFQGGKEVSIGVHREKFLASPHGGRLACQACHEGYEKFFTEGEHDYFGGTYEAFREKTAQACAACHEKTGEALEASAHAGGVTCTECHGSHEIRNARVEAADVQAFCGRCHEGAAEAENNVHERAVREGNPNAPTCIECHGFGSSHAVTADRRRMAAACGRCHAANQRELDASAHGKGGVTCVRCHGAHEIGGTDLAPSRSAAYCGRCHEDIAAEYDRNVHGIALARGVKASPSCTGCHGSTHALQAVHEKPEGPDGEPGPSFAETFRRRRCAACHEAVDPGFRESHGFLLPVDLHLGPSLGCACHTVKDEGAHILRTDNQPVSGMDKMETCSLCHNRDGKLLPAVKDTYVIGATRKDWIDIVGVLLVALTFVGLPLGHGGLRLLTGAMRKSGN